MTQMPLKFDSSSSKAGEVLPGANMFFKLPTEITLNIFSYLTHSDLAHCAVVCREWYYISSDPTLWHHLNLSNLAQTSLPHHTIPPTLERRLTLCRSLTLDSPTRIGPIDILHLLYHASHSLHLHSLTLASLSGFRAAAPHLEHFFLSTKTQSLTHVDLSNTAVGTPVVQALMKAHRTTLVELKLAFTEIGDGALRSIAAGECLESVSVAGCFGLSRGALRAWMVRRIPWSVRRVDLRWLVDVRVGWVGDMLARNAVAEEKKRAEGGRLEVVDVSGCERLTLKEVRSLEERWKMVKLSHSAVLVEDSVWGYRKYVEYLTTLQPLPGLFDIGEVAGGGAGAVVSPQTVC